MQRAVCALPLPLQKKSPSESRNKSSAQTLVSHDLNFVILVFF